jgi:hypothetical protein
MGKSLSEFTPTAQPDGYYNTGMLGDGVMKTSFLLASKAGYTTDDLRSDTGIFLGFAVNSGYAYMGDPAKIATYNMVNYQWEFYTGTDFYYQPTDTALCHINNSLDNNVPGKTPGQRFTTVAFTLDQVLPQVSLSFKWTLGYNKIQFTNGQQVLIQSKGTSSDPTFPYVGDTQFMQIADDALPGLYTLTCECSGGNWVKPPSTPSGKISAQTTLLIIPFPTALFHEF